MRIPDPPEGILVVGCRPNYRRLTVRGTWMSKEVATLCGHRAWTNEVISLGNATIEERKRQEQPHHEKRIVCSCTLCEFGEKTDHATLCSWCKKMILPSNRVMIIDEAISFIELTAPPTLTLWEQHLVVCTRPPCIAQARKAHAQGKTIRRGTWNYGFTIIVDPC